MRLGLIASLAGLALVVTGFTPGSAGGERFDAGNLIVAGTDVRERTPSGTIVRAFDTGGVTRAVAVSGDILYVGGDTSTLLLFNPDGTRGMTESFPEGFDVTAMDANASHIYAATTDGRFLHQLYRIDPAGPVEFPRFLEAPATSLDIASDDCTLFYSTLTRGIRRMDVCHTESAGTLLLSLAANDIALLPDATLLAAPRKGGAVVRIRSDGKVVRRYKRGSRTSWKALALTPDASAFWAADSAGRLVEFQLSSGRILKTLAPAEKVRDLLVVGAPQGDPGTWRGRDDGSLELDGVPTLTGEGFVDQDNGRPTPPEPCSPASESTLHFNSTSLAVGPYRGTYASMQTARLGPQTIQEPSGPLGVPVGRLLDLEGGFTISSGARTVSGTLALPKKTSDANSGTCLSFQNMSFPHSPLFPPERLLTGYYRSLNAHAFLYRATISANGRQYVDSGDSALFTDEYYLTDTDGSFAGSANRYEQTFQSRSVSVTDRFASKRDRHQHTVDVRGNRTTATLVVRWTPGSTFTVKGISFHRRSTRELQGGEKLKPGKLKPGGIVVRTTRKGRTLRIVITKLKPGELRFTVVPARLSGSAAATTTLADPG